MFNFEKLVKIVICQDFKLFLSTNLYFLTNVFFAEVLIYTFGNQ